MKKVYIAPEIVEVNVFTSAILAASVEKGEETGSEGGDGGLIEPSSMKRGQWGDLWGK